MQNEIDISGIKVVTIYKWEDAYLVRVLPPEYQIDVNLNRRSRA